MEEYHPSWTAGPPRRAAQPRNVPKTGKRFPAAGRTLCIHGLNLAIFPEGFPEKRVIRHPAAGSETETVSQKGEKPIP